MPNTAFLDAEERTENIIYTVKEGDYPGAIATKHRVSVNQIIRANAGVNLGVIHPGSKTCHSADSQNPFAFDFKIIPDSELVYGESLKDFDTIDVVNQSQRRFEPFYRDLLGWSHLYRRGSSSDGR